MDGSGNVLVQRMVIERGTGVVGVGSRKALVQLNDARHEANKYIRKMVRAGTSRVALSKAAGGQGEIYLLDVTCKEFCRATQR
jgi:hypothetical protein